MRDHGKLLSEYSVYTILHPDKLAEMAKRAGPSRVSEGRRWVAGKALLDDARDKGQVVPALFADGAHDCSKLLYWGILTSVTVSDSGTEYTVVDLKPIESHRTQELVLKSTGEPIAEGFIRPYAIVRTPAFIQRPAPSEPVTLFSFGYWGCGGAVRQLVDAIDAAEAARGFGPPLWVDVRVSRSVRAAGFRDRALEVLLGARYVWMPDLGNKRVRDGGRGIEIVDPSAADELLNHAFSDTRRRVIFFCACERPAICHRREVATLAVRTARRRGADVIVVEWPGGEPREVEMPVAPSVLRKIQRGTQKTLPLPPTLSAATAAALPWFSRITLQAGEDATTVLCGPARFDVYGVHLPVLGNSVGEAARLAKDSGCAPLRSR